MWTTSPPRKEKGQRCDCVYTWRWPSCKTIVLHVCSPVLEPILATATPLNTRRCEFKCAHTHTRKQQRLRKPLSPTSRRQCTHNKEYQITEEPRQCSGVHLQLREERKARLRSAVAATEPPEPCAVDKRKIHVVPDFQILIEAS